MAALLAVAITYGAPAVAWVYANAIWLVPLGEVAISWIAWNFG